MRKKLDALATILICAAALFVAGTVGFRQFAAPKRQLVSPRSTTTPVEGWDSLVAVGIRVGEPDARVTILEFADFECPFCARFSDAVRQVRAEYGRDVAHVFVHYPLPNHRFARPAARAAECADRLGHFSKMHDVLFAKQDSLGLKSWASYAVDAGIPDTSSFSRCTRETRPIERIDAGRRAGARIGVTGTPTVVINGLRYSVVPGDSLSKIVGVLLGR